MTSVAVLGGGVAGLSAAHELAERGFSVTIHEKRAVPGGKARSYPAPESGLPAEHGFRFFPGFYRHLPDTMARIPAGAGTVRDREAGHAAAEDGDALARRGRECGGRRTECCRGPEDPSGLEHGPALDGRVQRHVRPHDDSSVPARQQVVRDAMTVTVQLSTTRARPSLRRSFRALTRRCSAASKQ